MDGTEILGRRRAVCQKSSNQVFINRLGKIRIFISGFQREGIVIKPNRKIRIQRLAYLGPLRRMNVGIDESGQQILL